MTLVFVKRCSVFTVSKELGVLMKYRLQGTDVFINFGFQGYISVKK